MSLNEKEIPKHWELKKLGEVCEIKSGKNQSKVINPNGKYPIYGSSGIFGYADEYICDEGTTVIGRKGTINSPIYVSTKFWNVDTAFGLCSRENLNSKFLYYFCKGFNFHKLDKSTTIPSLSKGDLLSIDFPLPPNIIQQHIVSKIEELFSELDKGIEDLKLAQQQLKTYRQSVLKWAFEGKLTEEWRKKHYEVDGGLEPPYGLLQNSDKDAVAGAAPETKKKKQKNIPGAGLEPTQPDKTFEISSAEGEGFEPPGLPKGWKWVKITELVEEDKHALKAGPFGSSLKKEFYVEKGYKIYGQEQVINDDPFYGDYYINEEKYRELSSCKIRPLDILISLVGTVGKVLLLPENCQTGIINPRLIKISLNRNIYLPKFFKYYFESSAVRSFYGAETRGTTMDVLNLGIIKTIPFPLCRIEEQQHVIQAIENRISVADKMEENIIQSLRQAEALRQSILKKAFEGKLI